MRILATGSAGFIGSAYVRHVLKQHPEDEIISLDLLTYAGNPANLAELGDEPRHRFVRGDIADQGVVDPLVSESDAVVNFAAETHVDRSLFEPEAFARANVVGVMTLLEAVRRQGKRLLQVSTDEVYGNVTGGDHSVESDPLQPRSPYSAAKAGGELMCRSYVVSYGADVVVTRGCNTIGPRQYPEKMVPLFVTNALQDLPLPVYGDGQQIRDWLHAEDHAAAIDLVLRKGRSGETYNVGAGNERPNLDVVQGILDRLGKPASLIAHVPDRPGHDRRYAINPGKLKDELGWQPARDFTATLNDTVDWYVEHPEWWQAIRAGGSAFAEYYDRQYGWRLAEASATDGSAR
ncbi:MAG: dTDP-glucose 4,6-dehydratase [Chloroflexia bacterium]|nr:dTDP-glucose 4,6-dehydratase [Chloroflexia bacterium]